MGGQVYAFIDGSYFRKVCDDYMQSLFGVPADINYAALIGTTRADRHFYYDCLNDLQKSGESQDDFGARVRAQQAAFDSIQSVPGFHVRLGSVSGTYPKLRQKKVDVLLAVEALDHAFRKNMMKICLFAGDLDFAPLVDSLVHLGTFVEIMYQPRSAARGLYSAADIRHPIRVQEVYGWSTRDFQNRYQIPHSSSQVKPSNLHSPTREGLFRQRKVEFYDAPPNFFLYAPNWDDYGQPLLIQSNNSEHLEKFFELDFGHIEWK